MLRTPNDQGLHHPLATTGLSQIFTNLAINHGYRTLAELLAIRLTNLVKMKWFTGTMVDELAWVVARKTH
jgi:hypothetical protein